MHDLRVEIEKLRNPVMDMVQDIDQQKCSAMKELERTQSNNRRLIKLTGEKGIDTSWLDHAQNHHFVPSVTMHARKSG